MTAALDDYRWLVTDGALWLAQAGNALAAGGGPSVGLIARLRKELTAPRAHLVIEQVELRRRALVKFHRAESLFFTRQGLEQATDEQVAACKARRFALEAPAADLCCGIGGDLLALAARGPVRGVDLDPLSAHLAETNARVLGFAPPRCAVEVGDATAFPVSEIAAWHIDPDRRPAGFRTTRGELFAPPLAAIEQLLAANPHGAVKLAPATVAPAAWQSTAELEWLGSRGECRQQVAWFGDLAREPGRRAATIVDAPGGPYTVAGEASDAVPVAASLGPYLYEPHAAMLAARLTAVLAERHELAAVSGGATYLTGRGRVSDPALAAFQVEEVLPFDVKSLRAYCREHKIGRLEIKKRGVDLDPDRLRRDIGAKGSEEATFLVCPLAGRVRAIRARRLHSENYLPQ